MIITETKLKGAYLIEPELYEDERGFFTTVWTEDALRGHDFDRVAECHVSYNRRRGTLRGMHFQAAPHAQAKLVRCTRGAAYDVIIDLRPESQTFRRWFAVELTAHNRLALLVPKGFAHGYQALADETEVFYFVSSPYAPASCRGVRWDDPAFGVEWPLAAERIIIKRDQEYPDFAP